MPTKLSPWFHRIATLLEDDDRQSALGDIEERGANFHAAIDLAALVLLRQLQAWKSWRTGLAATTLILPAFAISNSAQAIASTVSYYPWPDLPAVSHLYFASMICCSLIATIALAWSTGFTIGLLGRHRTIGLLLPLALVPVWFSAPPLNQLWQHSGFAATVALCLATMPLFSGIARGWRGIPLSTTAAISLAALCVPFALLLPNAPYWSARWITLLAFWPLGNALLPSLQQRRTSHAD